MLAISIIAMFVVMYLNSYQMGYVYFSETRVYMALPLGATMAVIILHVQQAEDPWTASPRYS